MCQKKSEFKLIDWISSNRHIPHTDVLTDIGDDMAIMRCGGEQLLVTTDMLLEGTHFDLGAATLEQVGWKAMACSLSDCAAMATVPFIAVVAVALPRNWPMDNAKQLHRGLEKAAAQFNCPIVGGDTTSWDEPLAINVTMLSRAVKHKPVLRSGAKPGDVIFVTGSLGGSLQGRHLSFEPRVNEAQLLADIVKIHAMLDLSDGLSSDLPHICEQSGVSAIIEASAIPVSLAAQKYPEPLQSALNYGEDFELLFTVSSADAERIIKLWPEISPLPITPVGKITVKHKTDLIQLQFEDGTLRPLKAKGWEHFCE